MFAIPRRAGKLKAPAPWLVYQGKHFWGAKKAVPFTKPIPRNELLAMVETTYKPSVWRGSVIVSLCCLAGILLLLVATVIVATLWVTRAQRADSLMINLAGRQRMLTQRFSKEVLHEVNSLSGRGHLPVGGDSSRGAGQQRVSQKTRALFETTAAALRYGGTTYGDPAMDQTVTVLATTNLQIQSRLAEVDDIWAQLQQAASGMQVAAGDASDNSTAYREQLDRFLRLDVACLKEMDATVRMYQADAEAKVARLTKIQYAAGAMAILAFAAFLRLVPEVTERRRSEEQLRLARGELEWKAAELEAANDELAGYAHAVAHDIMAPLGAIHDYADLPARGSRPGDRDHPAGRDQFRPPDQAPGLQSHGHRPGEMRRTGTQRIGRTRERSSEQR